MSSLDRDGVRIHYEIAGNGPALLLTHGFTGSSADWAKNVDALAGTNTVICWGTHSAAFSRSSSTSRFARG